MDSNAHLPREVVEEAPVAGRERLVGGAAAEQQVSDCFSLINEWQAQQLVGCVAVLGSKFLPCRALHGNGGVTAA